MNTWLLVIIGLALITKSLADDTENPEIVENEVKNENLMKTFPKKMLARRREVRFN
jgi:hypothetical protein